MISVYTLRGLPLGSHNGLNGLTRISIGSPKLKLRITKIHFLQLFKIHHHLGLFLVSSTLLLIYFVNFVQYINLVNHVNSMQKNSSVYIVIVSELNNTLQIFIPTYERIFGKAKKCELREKKLLENVLLSTVEDLQHEFEVCKELVQQ